MAPSSGGHHREAIKFCTGATLGDAGIALIAFWAVAAFRSREWVLNPSPADMWAFTLLGLGVTAAARPENHPKRRRP